MWCLFHNWYYGCFQTGERSPWTGDHIGVHGRVCLDCGKRQITEEYGKYKTVDSFRRLKNGQRLYT